MCSPANSTRSKTGTGSHNIRRLTLPRGPGGSRRMNGGKKKFGGGRVPTGTPSLAWSSVVVVASLLAGASIVHNIYKPDMTLPPVEVADSNGSGAGSDDRKES
ncbi:unnamed protein product [Triticum turgidum subsp. durum]|uniref:Transmembrane protein n=1 Tax=Triticum turgidum subsp. durum TaxID=4567 RepID=A0A9R1R0E1_TRITD|nr:unnamed protein product [Triticum turgidum subsp. durum]